MRDCTNALALGVMQLSLASYDTAQTSPTIGPARVKRLLEVEQGIACSAGAEEENAQGQCVLPVWLEYWIENWRWKMS